MQVLVTGSEGFIGSHLISVLENRGHTVERFDVRNDAEQTVADYERLYEAFERNEYVFHLAAVADVWAEDRSELFDANVLGVRNITRAARETSTPVLFTSSVTAREPTNLYAETKKIGEDICQCADGPIAWVRLSNVVGSGTKKGQVAAMVEQAVTDTVIEVWGDGDIKRTYVSVETVCEYLYRIFKQRQIGFCGEIGSRTMTNYEMASIIAGCLESQVTINRVSKMPPSPKELVVSIPDEGDVQDAVFNQVEWFKSGNGNTFDG